MGNDIMVDFYENVGLVYYVYNTYYQRYRDIEDDLIQEGMMGLWKACQTFNPSIGSKFSTYAVRVIKNAMGMYVRKEARSREVYSLDRLIDEDEPKMTFWNIISYDEQEDERNAYALEVLMKVAKEHDCEELVRMRLEGMRQVDIAKELGIHQSTVSERLSRLYALVRKELGLKEK